MINVLVDYNCSQQLMSIDTYTLIKRRTIVINTEINPDTAAYAIMQLRYLADRSNDPICIEINSPGGVVDSGFAIIDTIEELIERGIEINTVVAGSACSMASLILLSASKGHRYCTKNSMVMMHQPLGGIRGQATEIKIACENILACKERVVTYISEKTNKSKEEVSMDIDRDYWLDALSAKEYGLIDVIGYPIVERY